MTNLYLKKNESFTATAQGTPLNLPGKENDPQPNTKILLIVLFNLNNYLKKNNRKNKPPVEHQGPLFYPSKSFAAHQNLVRLSI